jgi:stage III sporulation protein AE
MKRLWIALCLLLLLPSAHAAEARDEISVVDVSALQEAVGEAGAEIDVRALMISLACGEGEEAVEGLIAAARRVILSEFGAMRVQLLWLIAPSLLWAVNRYLLGGSDLSETAGLVCFVCAAGMLLNLVNEGMVLTRQTMQRTCVLTARFFPIISGLKGITGAADMLSPVVTLIGGALSVFLEKAVRILAGGAAAAAIAGNLSTRVPQQSLFRLFCTAGNWLLGGVMAVFGAMISLCGIVGSANGSIAMKTVKYAVGTLLPIVGGEVAGSMEVMTASASAVCGAAGITGVLVMLCVCLRPVVRLTGSMLCCMISSALTEPVADGSLRRCTEQIGQVVRLLTAASCVNAVLFIVLTGTICA